MQLQMVSDEHHFDDSFHYALRLKELGYSEHLYEGRSKWISTGGKGDCAPRLQEAGLRGVGEWWWQTMLIAIVDSQATDPALTSRILRNIYGMPDRSEPRTLRDVMKVLLTLQRSLVQSYVIQGRHHD